MKNLLCNTETEIPEVDNTDIPCDVFYSSECVVMQNLSQTVRNYFNIGDTPTLTEYAEAVGLALKDARERIITLENSGGGGGTPQPNPQLFRTDFAGFNGSIEVYEDGLLTQTISTDNTDFTIDISKQFIIIPVGGFDPRGNVGGYIGLGDIGYVTEGTYNFMTFGDPYVTVQVGDVS